ncbi:MAG TPA: uracil-DNA glycosylase family protein [Polyangiaceae bacterium]|nr:uracil-DNA glycosylase family protein [Polyangiaceae bacterium]
MAIADTLVKISRDLSRGVSALRFAPPVTHVYDPLDYARAPHEAYLRAWGGTKKRVLLLGMNPGPFGMAQTGVPFGDVSAVRDFLRVGGAVKRPPEEHPKRPVQGFDCPRSEVSGTRLWGFAKERFSSPERFFRDYFVVNYCPLAFMEESGKNFTPDKLPRAERDALFSVCDAALARVVSVLEPEFVVGVGAFARDRARDALPKFGGTIGTVLHPSPASPKANQGWARIVAKELAELGAPLP